MNATSNRQTWLGASLFPFKLYAVFAAVWLVIWHSRLPPNRMQGINLFFDAKWAWAASDFAFMAHVVVLGYVVATVALLLGGACQLLSGSRKAGCVSLACACATLVLGWLLRPYQDEALLTVL